jgi:hypothetical protein
MSVETSLWRDQTQDCKASSGNQLQDWRGLRRKKEMGQGKSLLQIHSSSFSLATRASRPMTHAEDNACSVVVNDERLRGVESEYINYKAVQKKAS